MITNELAVQRYMGEKTANFIRRLHEKRALLSAAAAKREHYMIDLRFCPVFYGIYFERSHSAIF